MKASKFSDAQKAFIVKRGEEGVPDLVQKTLARPEGTLDSTSVPFPVK
ncbi:hypothetical protein LAL4801_06051 [Roseibium aggregatum]|uniref:Uncharacterized protein n=1 Tax=Roseibium aggregatum TaxID=187304 RepID=A0A0M6YDS5_9HYPH|nr:hypothetical protein LAL4801_06051 [Roseibium aggregatum]